MIEKNSVVKVVLLSIVTLGIYVFIWAYQTMRNLDQLDGRYDKNYAVCIICLIFVPFYSWYWFYSRSDRIAEISQQHQVLNGNNKIINLVFAILGLSIISIAIMQNDLNNIVEFSDQKNNYTDYL